MSPDDRLRVALAEAVPTAAGRAELLAAFVDAPVLAAVSATSTGDRVVPGTGLVAESGATLAVLLIEGPDGSRALPVFPDVEALRRWRLDARPVRLTGGQACAAALDEGAAHLVIDPAGAAVVLEAEELRSLSGGWVPVPGSSLSTRRGSLDALTAPADVPAGLLTALRAAVQGESLRAARLLAGDDGLVLGVCGRSAFPPAELAALAQRITTRLGPALPQRGIGLVEVAASGLGLPLLNRRSGLFRRRERPCC